MSGENSGEKLRQRRPILSFWRGFCDFCRYFLSATHDRLGWPLFRHKPYDVAPYLIVIVTAVFGTFFLDRLDTFHIIEMRLLDKQLAVQKTQPSQKVYIVKINDADYSGLFGAESPLKACKVKELVSAVADLSPTVIGVDLYTTDAAWRTICDPTQCTPGAQLPKLVYGDATTDSTAQDTTCLKPKNGTAVIWAATPESTSNQETYTWQKNEDLVVLPPLGGQWRRDWESFSGVPGFPQDSDGRVRSYVGEFKVNRGTATVKSLAAAVAQKYDGAVGSENPLVFNFGSPTEFPSISAGDLMRCHGPPSTCVFKTPGKDGHEVPLPPQMVVLIGGEFRAARDTYDTPRGLMSGVKLNAMAIESDLQPGGGFREPGCWARLLFDLGLGIGGTFAYWFFESNRHVVWAILVSTLGASVVALFISYRLFHVFAYCLPVLVGINIHQYYEHLILAAKIEKETTDSPGE
jgi:CHASE2 domain-containing sensor protein